MDINYICKVLSELLTRQEEDENVEVVVTAIPKKKGDIA